MVSKKEVKHYYFTVIIAKPTAAEFLDQGHESTVALSTIDQDCHNAFLSASSREKSRAEVCIILIPPEDCLCARKCKGCGWWFCV